MGGRLLSHAARKFETLLEPYRSEDGGKWSGIRLERATGGVVTRSYVTNLRKGRIENPGMDKLWAPAKMMGFSPPALWFEVGLSGARSAAVRLWECGSGKAASATLRLGMILGSPADVRARRGKAQPAAW
jgi:hypothetical protein